MVNYNLKSRRKERKIRKTFTLTIKNARRSFPCKRQEAQRLCSVEHRNAPAQQEECAPTSPSSLPATQSLDWAPRAASCLLGITIQEQCNQGSDSSSHLVREPTSPWCYITTSIVSSILTRCSEEN
jgi:hypothetical protein